MNINSAAIRAYFAKLDLQEEIADLYLALYTHGPQSISELSRSSRVERTRIYRLIDTLLESNLIEVETHYKRGMIKAAPIANLHILISQKEQELKSLQEELGLIEQLLARNSLSSPATRVQFYHGAEGAKQMFWNQIHPQTDKLCVLYNAMQANTGKAFFERWVEAMNQTPVNNRIIGGDNFYKTLRDWWNKYPVERTKKWHGRYISDDVYPIEHSMVIYNDVLSFFNWKDNEIFGIEIYNQQIADSHRKLFEMLWEKSSDRTPLDNMVQSPGSTVLPRHPAKTPRNPRNLS